MSIINKFKLFLIILIGMLIIPLNAAKTKLEQDTVQKKKDIEYLDESLGKFFDKLKIKTSGILSGPVYGVEPYSNKKAESRPAGKMVSSDLYSLLKVLRYDLQDPKLTPKTWKSLKDKVENCLKNIESTLLTDAELTKLIPIDPKTINLRIPITNLVKPYLKSLKNEAKLLRIGAERIVAHYEPKGNA